MIHFEGRSKNRPGFRATILFSILPILVGTTVLLFITSDFLNTMVKLITRHDEMALILRTELGYSTPDYYTYFFNNKVGSEFIETLHIISSSFKVVLLCSSIFISIYYLKKHFTSRLQLRKISLDPIPKEFSTMFLVLFMGGF